MKIYIGYNYTCNLNYVPAYIQRALTGFLITQDVKEADVILFIGTCACTAKQIANTLAHIASVCSLKKEGARVYATGCITKKITDPKLSSMVSEVLNKYIDEIVAFDNPDKLLSLINSDRFKETNPKIGCQEVFYDYGASNLYITNGCNNRCTFCRTNFLDSNLHSVFFDEVIKWIDSLDMQGIGHIYLKGTNIAQYGYDLYHEYLLGELLKYIEKKRNIFTVDLVGYGFADGIRCEQEKVIREMPKIRTLSGGLESGSNRILGLMNKGFTAKEFLSFILECKKYFAREFILNIISGFPTETRDDIDMTVNLLREIDPYYVQICQYSDSWFVPSHKFTQFSEEEKEEHTAEYMRKLSYYDISFKR